MTGIPRVTHNFLRPIIRKFTCPSVISTQFAEPLVDALSRDPELLTTRRKFRDGPSVIGHRECRPTLHCAQHRRRVLTLFAHALMYLASMSPLQTIVYAEIETLQAS